MASGATFVGSHAPMKILSHVVFSDFLDHAGNPATSVMATRRPPGTPINRHPFSFQIYMVNGIKYSPIPSLSPLPLVADLPPTLAEDLVTKEAAPSSDESTTKIREFLIQLHNSLQDGGGTWVQRFCFAVYFLPAGASVETCMEHYELERQYSREIVQCRISQSCLDAGEGG